MSQPHRGILFSVLAIFLSLFTLAEVNYPFLAPQTQLGFFALLGMILCFLYFPLDARLAENRWVRASDYVLIVLAVFCFGYVATQSEPRLQAFWVGGVSLGNRAGQETGLDLAIGVIGLLLVLEGTRRSIGWALPVLSILFLTYCLWGNLGPSWLLPHRGYSVERTVSQTFLQSQGVFGVALRVMFTYVFLFIIFGAFLRATGATQFIVDFARRFFRKSPGGPAKVAVLSSGLMGSLSGSAVANTATTGTFTIPMMRASGYKAETAGGVEAAASTGGALVPPVMGAAAYMMLEMVSPPVTYLQIIKAALIPAVLYYLSLFLIVHFYSRKIGAGGELDDESPVFNKAFPVQAAVFSGAFASLLLFLFMGYTAFRSVSLSLLVIIGISMLRKETRLNLGRFRDALVRGGRDVVPLVAAASCVGIIIGVVTLTGVGNKFPSLILPLAEGSLFLALLVIMFSSIVLGMGLPSAVCYLLMATLIGPVLGQLGVVPLAAHLFIFYFGMMSMVTPPVALAAFAASSIAGSGLMLTALAAFRFALVGFTLPFMFVFRPELLMLSPGNLPAEWTAIFYATAIAAMGVLAFAAGIAGYLVRPLSKTERGLLFFTAALLLFPGQATQLAGIQLPLHDLMGAGLLAGFILWKVFQTSPVRAAVAQTPKEGPPAAP
jgi:TRAP transporter 4TM/12TM fusion protein